MKLRNFLYLNTKVTEDYVSAIDGFTYNEESQELETSNENVVAGKAAIGVALGMDLILEGKQRVLNVLYESVMQQSSIRYINFFNPTKMMG